MSHHALLEYVHRAREIGASDQEITDRLHSAGWYRVDIQDALELHGKITQPLAVAVSAPIAAQNTVERLSPRTYDPHLIVVAVLSVVVGFIGYFWIVR